MTDIVERLRAWHTPGGTITGDVQLYLDAADEIDRLQADRQELAQENDTLVRTVVLLRADIDRLQEAKRAALKLADERAKEANDLRAKLESARKALQQIITICGDNTGRNARHDMALRCVRGLANAAYPDERAT